jgi:hypothetical protein
LVDTSDARLGLGSIVVSGRHIFAFRLRIPTHGVAFFESDFMIALGPRQGDIVCLSSANTQRRDDWYQEIFMVETTQHGVRAHGNILAQAMSGSAIEVMMRCRRRIRDTGTQGHMGTRPIVMGNPRFQNRP